MKLFEMIVDAVIDYDVSAEVKEHVLALVNHDNGNKLYVYEEEYYSQDMTEHFVEYIVQFSTQHRHFSVDEEDDIIEYVLAILSDEVLPLEFYRDGQGGRGGEIYLEDLDKLSVSFLAEQFYYTSDHLLDYLLSLDYEIHSWSGKYDTGLRKVSDLKP
ncbi:MAG: hypothetical protein IJH07_00120 [Ruminococcus sp.]|nr:hypothetical protein [Ruminococcus sp.]